MNDEQDDDITRVNAWDVAALLAHTISDILLSIAEFFHKVRDMLLNKASYVEDDKNFHEYVTRTIETLREGE
jgi:uncharacterized protein YccT (UPF0319 family)